MSVVARQAANRHLLRHERRRGAAVLGRGAHLAALPLSLCLRALTRPGDTVAVESPAYFGTLQAIEVLGLRALEIPVDPETGLSLETLAEALDRGQVAALVVTPNVHNPLGCVMPDDRKRALVALLAPEPAGTQRRADVLRAVAEDADLARAEFNRAFVLLQYFGYLRRDPDDAPDSDFAGYNFWLTQLNNFNGNFEQAEMVRAFIESIEYRTRFGP